MKKKFDVDSLKAIPLGGHGECGKNSWIIEYKNEIIIIDFGMMLPPSDLSGVDLVLPNASYLVDNQEKIKGLILTSAHDNMSGGAFYLINKINIPKIWGSKLAIETLRNSVDKNTKIPDTEFISSRNTFKVGNEFEIKPIQNTSVLPDTYGLFIKTSVGNILYTGSFKVDQTPLDEKKFDYFSYAESGETGVDLLISNSSNIETLGYTQTERLVTKRFEDILKNKSRIIVTTYACNLYKIQILLNIAEKMNRRVFLHSEYLAKKVKTSIDTGFISASKNIIIEENDLNKYKDEEILVILSGKFGDFLKPLIEYANEKHEIIKPKQNDIVVVSANAPPGTARILAHTLDQLFVQKIQVIGGKNQGVHVSGQAALEECKLMLTITRPRSFAPSLGEERHLVIYEKIGEAVGINHNDIHILKNGDVLEIREQIARVAGKVPAQCIYYNYTTHLEIDEITMSERLSLSDEGTITVALALDENKKILAGPEILAEGCAFAKGKDWRAFCLGAIELIKQAIEECIKKEEVEIQNIKSAIKDTVNKSVLELIGKRPLINISIQEITSESKKIHAH